MEFLSLRRRRSTWRNVPSDEEQGETAVFAGYNYPEKCDKASWLLKKNNKLRISNGKTDEWKSMLYTLSLEYFLVFTLLDEWAEMNKV